MRKVLVTKLIYPSGCMGRPEQVELGEATFHQFGIDYQEFSEGPGNFSIAIIEYPDGRVDSVRPERIRFLDSQGERNAD